MTIHGPDDEDAIAAQIRAQMLVANRMKPGPDPSFWSFWTGVTYGVTLSAAILLVLWMTFRH